MDQKVFEYGAYWIWTESIWHMRLGVKETNGIGYMVCKIWSNEGLNSNFKSTRFEIIVVTG